MGLHIRTIQVNSIKQIFYWSSDLRSNSHHYASYKFKITRSNSISLYLLTSCCRGYIKQNRMIKIYKTPNIYFCREKNPQYGRGLNERDHFEFCYLIIVYSSKNKRYMLKEIKCVICWLFSLLNGMPISLYWLILFTII